MAKSPVTYILEKDPDTGWYTSKIKEFPQVISQGKTKQEAINNVIDALNLFQTDFMNLVKEGEKGTFKVVGTFEEFKNDVLKSLKKNGKRNNQ